MRVIKMDFSTNSSCSSGLAAIGSFLRKRRLLLGMLMFALLFSGVSQAANALIVWNGVAFGPESDDKGYLNTALVNAGYTVTLTSDLTSTPLVSGGSPLFKQVWDIRFGPSEPLSGGDIARYVAYLNAGGRLIAIGENTTNFLNRDTSVASLVLQAGGGGVTPVNANGTESVEVPFTTRPASVTSIVFSSAGGLAAPLPAGAVFINKDTNNDGVGTGIVWPIGILTNGAAGILITVFDSDFIGNTGDANSVAYLANLIGYMDSAPYITLLTPNSGPVATSVVITGGNFGVTQSGSIVRFNGTAATVVTSWGMTSITANVPTGAATGNVTVTVNGVVSNGVPFTVTASAPPVPTLSETAMILLACGLIAIAFWRMRRSYSPSAI
jgi:hypothetical protein